MINENGLLNIFPTAEASGSIVSFENGADGIPMESLSVAVEPTQDLHGYSHPWPAGGGKNKLKIKDKNSSGITGSYNTSGEYVIIGTSGSVAAYCDFQPVTLPAGSYTFSISTLPDGLSSAYNKNGSWAGLVTDGKTITLTEETEIGGYISIPANTEVNTTIKIQLEIGSTATAWTPYSNICPISGRTGLSVYRTGKNLFNPHLYAGIDYNPTVGAAVTLTDAAQQFTDNGSGVFTLTISSTCRQYSIVIPVVEVNNYHVKFSCSSSGQMGTTRGFLDANHKVLQKFNSTDVSQSYNYNMVVPTGAAYFYMVITNRSTASATLTLTQPQFEIGSAATTYEPYNGTTYAVDWTSEAGTVYGGTLDVVTGELVVNKVCVSLNPSWYWYVGATQPNGLTVVSTTGFPSHVVGGEICSHYKRSTTPYIVGLALGEFITAATSAYFCFKGSSGGTADEFKEYLTAQATAGTPVQVVYELATPLTYQLTPQEVATLLGANRVWSDAGDISLVYHTQVDATPSSIDGLFINGEGLQADGWFLKWRKLAAPKPKTDYVSVWGRDGDIDLTESETDGQVFYENRELTMDMVYIGEDWTDAYSELLDMLHGKECAVQFLNDPYWYWAGRIIASLYEHKPHSLAMSGIMFPYKLSVAKVTKSVTVSGAIESNGVEVVLPSSRMRVSPKVTVVAGTGESVTLKWGTKTQTLSAGTYYVRGLKVGSNDVTIKVWGTGTVTFEYRKGML